MCPASLGKRLRSGGTESQVSPVTGLTDPPQPHRKNLPSPSGWLVASRSFLRFCSHVVNSLFDAPAGHEALGTTPTHTLPAFRAFAGHSAPRGTFSVSPWSLHPTSYRLWAQPELSVYPSSVTCPPCDLDQIPILRQPVSSPG